MAAAVLDNDAATVAVDVKDACLSCDDEITGATDTSTVDANLPIGERCGERGKLLAVIVVAKREIVDRVLTSTRVKPNTSVVAVM